MFLRRNSSCFDITFKDVETVQGDPARIKPRADLVREISGKE
jgi:hypothetical protein